MITITPPTIQNFSLQSCSSTTCISAKGEGAFVSQTHQMVSATHITLKITKIDEKTKTVECAEFRYDFATEFLTCDNREAGRPSLTIDRRFNIAKF